ncbi:hypothetical protein ACHWQZ_G001788 [Mnemiopsis leidyi]
MLCLLIILLLFYQSFCAVREREAGEITQVCVEHSATRDNNEELNSAGHAIDLDLTTSSGTVPGSDGTPWFKITLDKVNCIEEVIWYSNDGNPRITWTCTDTDCSICVGAACSNYILTVSTEEAVSDLSPVNDCKHGDTVKLEKIGGTITKGFTVIEIAVIRKQEAECTTHDSACNNDGKSTTLNCPGRYTNLRGNTSTCQYGQVAPTNQPSDCKGKNAIMTK